jgi:nucleoside-diphosphate-sugar epimerase
VKGCIFIFGLGYTASRLADRLTEDGWEVLSTGSNGSFAFNDRASVALALDRATHVLSSVPPAADGDPVLDHYGNLLGSRWLGYLSSTGVYGDAGGAWVDESAPVNGRRGNRNQADLDWQAQGARVFRLPGIYGPGRSMLDRVAAWQAHRIDLPDQVFSRVHVDDIVSGVIAAFDAPSGVYNLADDLPCSQNRLVEHGCALLGVPVPPLQSLEEAQLSSAALAFYAENRRVANGKAKRVMGWRPAYPDFMAGLGALSATTMPRSATALPAKPSAVQR